MRKVRDHFSWGRTHGADNGRRFFWLSAFFLSLEAVCGDLFWTLWNRGSRPPRVDQITIFGRPLCPSHMVESTSWMNEWNSWMTFDIYISTYFIVIHSAMLSCLPHLVQFFSSAHSGRPGWVSWVSPGKPNERTNRRFSELDKTVCACVRACVCVLH